MRAPDVIAAPSSERPVGALRFNRAAVKRPPHEPSNGDLEAMVERIASEEGVEAPLVHSVIQAESNYDTSAVSAERRTGIMQLIPSTAQPFRRGQHVSIAEENIQGGVKYLKFLLDYYRRRLHEGDRGVQFRRGRGGQVQGCSSVRGDAGYVGRWRSIWTAERQKTTKQATPTQPDSETPHHTYSSQYWR